MSKLEPGKYIATVEDYGIGQSKEKKTPSLDVKFKVKDTNQYVYWQAYLTVNTIERVTENLVECELLSSKNFNDVAKGTGINTQKEVQIVVVHEDYESNGEKKVAVKVAFVNPFGSGVMKNVLAESEAISILAGLNIDAHIAAAVQKTGKEITPSVAAVPEVAPEEIPF